MKTDINLKFENIYCKMNEKEDKQTKKLIDEPVSTASADPFFCSNICDCLLGCCFLLCV